MDISKLQEFARRNRVNPTWREFKAKWDGRSPRKGTKLYAEFVADTEKVQRSVEKILAEI